MQDKAQFIELIEKLVERTNQKQVRWVEIGADVFELKETTGTLKRIVVEKARASTSVAIKYSVRVAEGEKVLLNANSDNVDESGKAAIKKLHTAIVDARDAAGLAILSHFAVPKKT